MAHYISLKDEKFTISLIGRPNVGKSTLFNTLMGKEEALVDRMPGLTRDRREGITEIFEMPVRIVDTAGFEDIESLEEPESRSLNKRMMQDMIMQTRNALIYSDLAIFILDAKSGLHPHDKALHDWIVQKKFAQQSRELAPIKDAKIENPEIIYDKPDKILKDTKVYKKELELFELQQSEAQMKRREVNFRSQFKNPLEDVNQDDIKIPKIIYVANKSESGRDIEYWKLGIDGVIPISAIHGDGMPDLYRVIKDHIPEEKIENFELRKQIRVQRHNEYKQMMLDELEELRRINIENENADKDFNPNELSNEFDYLNPNPEYNSDFDSDNEVNPLDTMNRIGHTNAIGGISTENMFKKKPIQLAVIGRPNVGKSTLVNGLLREDRVIANDLPGTTRDAISIQWIHKGRRVNLVDTAGIKINARNKDKIEQLVRDSMQKVLNHSHVAIVLIDSMSAFTTQDFAIMTEVIDQGRGLIVAANKWDIVAEKYKRKAVQWMQKQ